MRLAAKGRDTSAGTAASLIETSKAVELLANQTGSITQHPSISAAARYLKAPGRTINSYAHSQLLYKGRYLIKLLPKTD